MHRIAIAALMSFAATPAHAHSDAFDKTTKIVLVAVPVGLVAYDAYLMTHDSNTVSNVLRDAAWKSNAVPYVLGMAAGHLFFSAEKKQDRLAYGLASIPIVVGIDLLTQRAGPKWYRHPGIWFALGTASGALTWGRDF